MYIKRIICLFTLLCMLPPFAVSAAADTVGVYINNEAVQCDTPPVVRNDRILTPFDEIFEKLGCDVFFNYDTKAVVIVKNEIKLILYIREKHFSKFTGDDFELFKQQKNSEEHTFDVPPQIIDGRIFVPLRAVCEALGADVFWDDESKSVFLTGDTTANTDKAFAPKAFVFLQQQETGADTADKDSGYEEGNLDILTEYGIVSEEDLNKSAYITNSEALETIHNVTGHYNFSNLKGWYGDEELAPLDYLDDDDKIMLIDLLYYSYILTYNDVLSMKFDENLTYYKALVYVTRMAEDKGGCTFSLEELDEDEEKFKTYYIAAQKKLISNAYIDNADLPIPRSEFYELIHKALFVEHLEGDFAAGKRRYIDSFLNKADIVSAPKKEVSVKTRTISADVKMYDDMSISWHLPQDITDKVSWTDISGITDNGTVIDFSTSAKVYTCIDPAQIILYSIRIYPEKLDYIRLTYYKYDSDADTREEYSLDIDIPNISMQTGGKEITPGVYTHFQSKWIPESISLADSRLFKKGAYYLITSYEHKYRRKEYNSISKAVFKSEENSNILRDIYTDENGTVLFMGSVYLEDMHLQEIIIKGTAESGFVLYFTPESKNIFTVKEGSEYTY